LDRLKKILIVLILAAFFARCTDPYALQTSNYEEALVIEATITNELKYQEIKITKTYKLEENFPTTVTDAVVILKVYQTGRPITYPIGKYTYGNSEFTLYSDRNQFRIPDYYRLDIGFNVEGTHKLKKLAHGFWNISIYNVLGRNNPYSVFFVTEKGQVKAYKTSIFAIPVPTITYNFKF